ncbi:hypothetical protein BW897_28175 [Bacillus cereus]|uniref:Uncharacterized protein n=1 Tax=Bacillus cereus TaxID=1396 RepID=A0A1S9THJ5_BACCE|nr:hypothetical protein [Bacillus cereus]OOR09367.1 hypothetical protein BW897_28175 [Bacillus cereus]
MGSTSSMPWAIRKTVTGWKRESAESILLFRKEHGKNSLAYKEIQDYFRCYGCYECWIRTNNSLPKEDQLPVLTHYDNKKVGGTYFQLRTAKGGKKQNHKPGCCYNDPLDYYKGLSTHYSDIKVDEKGSARLNILKKKLPTHRDPINLLRVGRTKGVSQQSLSFGALQEIYNRYQQQWTELLVKTEDNQEAIIGALLKTPLEARSLAINQTRKIMIVHGTIKKVLKRNSGGYINILFKDDSNGEFHPFRLSVSPDHIFNEDDLLCLENRNVGCYGYVDFNPPYLQMDFLYLQQIVLFDLKEDESFPFRLPNIKIERLDKVISDKMAKYQSTENTYNPSDFSYYLKRQDTIPLLQEQVEKNNIEKESLLQEIFHIKQDKNNVMIQLEQHQQLLHEKRDTLRNIEHNLQKDKNKLGNRTRSLLAKIFPIDESIPIQALLSKKELLVQDIKSVQDKIQQYSQRIIDYSQSKTAIEETLSTLNKNQNNLWGEIQHVTDGLTLEVEWHSFIEKVPRLIFHNRLANMWIAFQINEYASNSSDLEILCVFHPHFNNTLSRLVTGQKKSIIRTCSNNLTIYKTIDKELDKLLKDSPLKFHKIDSDKVLNHS